MPDRPTIAAFRPPGERAESATEVITEVGANALIDPMIVPEPTGRLPRSDADAIIFTSSTAADILDERHWATADAEVIAIGPKTADALREISIDVDAMPEEYTSGGLVDLLADRVDGMQIEIARSDHGSDELIDGLWEAGGYVHETVLYRLVRPEGAGDSVEATIAGEVDALAFSSSLTVANFVGLAEESETLESLHDALNGVVIGAIGPPTAETATDFGLTVDVIADEATFESLIAGIIEAI